MAISTAIHKIGHVIRPYSRHKCVSNIIVDQCIITQRQNEFGLMYIYCKLLKPIFCIQMLNLLATVLKYPVGYAVPISYFSSYLSIFILTQYLIFLYRIFFLTFLRLYRVLSDTFIGPRTTHFYGFIEGSHFFL